MQVLDISFKVREEESLVFLDRPAKRCAELIALEGRRGSKIKVVGSVEGVVAEKFVGRAVELVGARLGDNRYLRGGPLAVLGSIVVAQDVKLSHSFDADEILAGATRR